MTRTGMRERTRRAHLAAMRGLPVFAGLSDAALRRLDAHMAEVSVPAGAVLVRQHEHGREALIVVAGCAAVSVDGVPVSSAGAGDLVGELSLLDNGRRTATVTALTPMRVLVLDARQFAALFDEPETARWVAATLARRLRGWIAAESAA